MNFLKQSTAVTVLLGPFVDDTDGKTPETALDVTGMDCDLYKGTTRSDLTLTASGGDNDCVHVANGYYSLELTAGNTDTAGRLRITVNVAGALPVWHDFFVLPAQVYDALVGTDKLEVDLRQWNGADVSPLADERNALADTLLSRDVANVEDTAGDHSLCYVVLATAESNTVDNPGKLTVYKTDGVTEFVQKNLTTDENADPITGVG